MPSSGKLNGVVVRQFELKSKRGLVFKCTLELE